MTIHHDIRDPLPWSRFPTGITLSGPSSKFQSRYTRPRTIVSSPAVLLGQNVVLNRDVSVQQLPELSLDVGLDERDIARGEEEGERFLEDLYREMAEGRIISDCPERLTQHKTNHKAAI